MRIYKLITIYVISYFFFGIIAFLFAFGFEESLKILKSSPMEDLNGTIIFFSALLASILVIFLMRKRLKLQPYPYFMLGFYVGNLSLLLIFIINGIQNYVVWTFPEFLAIFFAPFMELLISYLFGFAFLALIPSWISAYILFKMIQNKEKQRF